MSHSAKVGDTFYRYEDPGYYDKGPVLLRFTVDKVTPKGVWIVEAESNCDDTRRFVLVGGRRAFAYPTEELALNSYIQRKRAQVQHLRRSMTKTMDRLHWAEEKAGRSLTPEPSRDYQRQRDAATAADFSWELY